MKVRSDSSVVGDSTTSATWTLISRITGFGRVLLIGAVLGPSYFGNLFQLGNQLPWLAFDLAIGALLGSLLVPALVRHVKDGDTASVERVASGFLGFVVGVFALIAVVVIVGIGGIAEVFALPIQDAETKRQFIAAAGPLMMLTAPQLVGYGVAITGQAVQHALGHYKVPAGASIAENMVVIATLIFFGIYFGTGVDIAEVTTAHILTLGVGSTLGVTAHAVIQMWGVRSLGLKIRPRAGWNDPDVRALLRQAVPTSGTAFLNGSRLLVLLVAANTVAGGVVAFQLALNVLNMPVALGAKPVVHALLPRLSRAHLSERYSEFADRYLRGVGFAFLLTIPIAVSVGFLGWFVSAGVAVGEMDTAAGRQLLAFGITGVAGAIVGDGLYHLATAASYSRADVRGPLWAQVLRVAVTISGCGLSIWLADGAAVILGLAVAMSLADVLCSVYLHGRVQRTLPPIEYRLSRSTLATVGCSVVGFGAAGFLAYWFDGIWSLQAPVAVLAASVMFLSLGLAVYLGLRHRLDGEIADVVRDFRSGPSPSVEYSEVTA